MSSEDHSKWPLGRRGIAGISAVAWVFMTVASVVIWTDSQKQELAQAERLLEHSTEQSTLRLQDYVGGRVFALQAVASSYVAGRPIQESTFRQSAQGIHENFDGILAVNWITADSTIVWTEPVAENLAAQGRKLRDHPMAAPYYKQAVESRAPVLTGPIELFQGGTGVAGYFPVFRNGEHLGTINGVFRVDELIRTSLRGGLLTNFSLHIVDGDNTVFTDPEFEDLSSRFPVERSRLEVLGREWKFELVPREDYWSVIRPENTTTLVFSLLSALLLAITIYFLLERQRLRLQALREQQRKERRMRQIEKFEALGRLARGITHDFNNLLTAVGTSAELIELDEALTPTGKENIDAIRQASERARELTRQLMLFGNPDAATGDTSTNIAEFADKWQRLLEKLVPSEVEFHFDSPPQVSVAIDDSSLLRVLTNLVVNACDAVEEGGNVRVTWEIHGDVIAIAVEDDGSGMPEDIQSRVFEPYFTTKGEDGTGLGLPTVYGIVQAAGGDIRVSSEVGVGSTFVVTLPLAE